MKKILVANRGEIALRVMKTAKKWELKQLLFIRLLIEILLTLNLLMKLFVLVKHHLINLLLGNKIIEVCKELGVDGIHPGYGFLSENADFSNWQKK